MKHYCHAFFGHAYELRDVFRVNQRLRWLHVFTLQQMDSKWVCFPFDDTQAKQDLCLCTSDQENVQWRKPSEL